jgi:predicted RNA-binding protein YlqC (UPF0109 family)
MSSIDQQFVEFVVKSLVSKPEAVQVERRIDEKGVLLELTVDPEDLGRVIGKRGATAQSLRTLLRALGTKNDARYNLKIVDNGLPGASHHDEQRPQPQPSEQTDPSASADDGTLSATSNDDTSSVATPMDEPNQPEEPVVSDRFSQTRRELEER